MEPRRLFLAMAISMLILMLWMRLTAPKRPGPQIAEQVPQQQAQTSDAKKQEGFSLRFQAKGSEDQGEKIISLGNDIRGNGYKMLVELTDQGAGVAAATLSEFSETVDDPDEGYRLLTPVELDDEVKYSLVTERAVMILSKEKADRKESQQDKSRTKETIKPAAPEADEVHQINLEQVKWFSKADPSEKGKVEFWVDIIDKEHDNRSILRIRKIYTLPRDKYDLDMELSAENLTDEPATVVIRQRGPLGVRREDPRADSYRKTLAAFCAAGQDQVNIDKAARKDVLKQDNYAYRLGPAAIDDRVVWAGQINKYFAALLAPADKDADRISSVEAKAYWPNKQELGEDLTTVWVTKPMKLAYKSARSSAKFELYLGPKSVSVFKSDPRYIQRRYSETIEYAWCTMQWLADVMVALLEGLHFVCRNYGLAIILMVIIVRVLMHPITKSSQINMFRMQRDMKRLQPKMQAVKEKYKNNRDAMNKAIMELYKQEGINPASQMLGCLPMALQMPIWVALWTALNNTFELRHQPFLPYWIIDLAAPDALVKFSSMFTLPFIGGMVGPIHSFNLLPILLGVSMFLQQKFTPQPAATDPAQAKQQKVMFYFMAAFMTLIFYNAPSGLNLYILTSNLLAFVESRHIRQHLEKESSRPQPAKRPQKSRWERLAKKLEQMAKQYETTPKKSKSRK